MSVKYSETTKTVLKCVGFECDRCKVFYPEEDFVNMQEALMYSATGGYGSMWGDGSSFTLALCQQCAYELLSDYVVYSDDDSEHIL